MTTSRSTFYSSGIDALMRKRVPVMRIGATLEEVQQKTRELQQETRVAWWTIGALLTIAIVIDLARNKHIWFKTKTKA